MSSLFSYLGSRYERSPNKFAKYLGDDGSGNGRWEIMGTVYTGSVTVVGDDTPTEQKTYPAFCADPDSWRNWIVFVEKQYSRIRPREVFYPTTWTEWGGGPGRNWSCTAPLGEWWNGPIPYPSDETFGNLVRWPIRIIGESVFSQQGKNTSDTLVGPLTRYDLNPGGLSLGSQDNAGNFFSFTQDMVVAGNSPEDIRIYAVSMTMGSGRKFYDGLAVSGTMTLRCYGYDLSTIWTANLNAYKVGWSGFGWMTLLNPETLAILAFGGRPGDTRNPNATLLIVDTSDGSFTSVPWTFEPAPHGFYYAINPLSSDADNPPQDTYFDSWAVDVTPGDEENPPLIVPLDEFPWKKWLQPDGGPETISTLRAETSPSIVLSSTETRGSLSDTLRRWYPSESSWPILAPSVNSGSSYPVEINHVTGIINHTKTESLIICGENLSSVLVLNYDGTKKWEIVGWSEEFAENNPELPIPQRTWYTVLGQTADFLFLKIVTKRSTVVSHKSAELDNAEGAPVDAGVSDTKWVFQERQTRILTRDTAGIVAVDIATGETTFGIQPPHTIDRDFNQYVAEGDVFAVAKTIYFETGLEEPPGNFQVVDLPAKDLSSSTQYEFSAEELGNDTTLNSLTTGQPIISNLDPVTSDLPGESYRAFRAIRKGGDVYMVADYLDRAPFITPPPTTPAEFTGIDSHWNAVLDGTVPSETELEEWYPTSELYGTLAYNLVKEGLVWETIELNCTRTETDPEDDIFNSVLNDYDRATCFDNLCVFWPRPVTIHQVIQDGEPEPYGGGGAYEKCVVRAIKIDPTADPPDNLVLAWEIFLPDYLDGRVQSVGGVTIGLACGHPISVGHYAYDPVNKRIFFTVVRFWANENPPSSTPANHSWQKLDRVVLSAVDGSLIDYETTEPFLANSIPPSADYLHSESPGDISSASYLCPAFVVPIRARPGTFIEPGE